MESCHPRLWVGCWSWPNGIGILHLPLASALGATPWSDRKYSTAISVLRMIPRNAGCVRAEFVNVRDSRNESLAIRLGLQRADVSCELIGN